jgi:hypothetical protein
VNEQLRIRLGEYLPRKSIDFDEITRIELYSDRDDQSIDVWYRDSQGLGVHEIREYELEEFLTFLVTGGE